MKHPMPRNRRKLKNRAARWKALKEQEYGSSFEGAMDLRMFGHNIMRGEVGTEPKGILDGS